MSARELSRNMRRQAEMLRPVTKDDERNHWCQRHGCAAWGANSLDGGHSWFCAKHLPRRA